MKSASEIIQRRFPLPRNSGNDVPCPRPTQPPCSSSSSLTTTGVSSPLRVRCPTTDLGKLLPGLPAIIMSGASRAARPALIGRARRRVPPDTQGGWRAARQHREAALLSQSHLRVSLLSVQQASESQRGVCSGRWRAKANAPDGFAIDCKPTCLAKKQRICPPVDSRPRDRVGSIKVCGCPTRPSCSDRNLIPRVRMARGADGAHPDHREVLCVAPAAGRISTRSAVASSLVRTPARGSRARPMGTMRLPRRLDPGPYGLAKIP